MRTVPVALAKGGVSKVGYFPGPGDEVPASLRSVGYDVTLLSEDAIARTRARWRASTRSSSACAPSTPASACARAHAALMAYVERGGTLVVQYNTNNRLAPLTAPLGP